MNPLYTFLLLVILFPACENEKGIPEDKLIKAYSDLLIIQDTTKTENISLDSLQAIALKKYDLTFPEYKEMILEYNQHPEKWEKFFEKVTAYVNELKAKSKN